MLNIGKIKLPNTFKAMIGNKQKIVQIVLPPQTDTSKFRGIGEYTQHLIDHLSKQKKYQLLLQHEISPKADLIHYPSLDFFKTTLPLIFKQPTILTVHDVIPIEYANHFPVGIKGKLAWLYQKQRLQSANFILTDSHSSKYSLHRQTGYPLSKIYNVYLGADTNYHPIPKLEAQKLAKNLHLPEQFVLYVGDINWNKNIPNLLNACLNISIPLVLVGKTASTPLNEVPHHPWTEDIRYLKIMQEKYPKLILTPGYLETKTINALYQLALCYCQPSFAEGFGLPLLQAMQAGCPAAYSYTTSLIEIGNYVGQIFNPEKTKQIEKCILQYKNDPKLREKSINNGLIQAQAFSWKKAAIQTLAVYDLAIK